MCLDSLLTYKREGARKKTVGVWVRFIMNQPWTAVRCIDSAKSLVCSHRTVEPGVPPSETWSTKLVMPAQLARVNADKEVRKYSAKVTGQYM